jgi:hypothetical protein
LNVQQTTIYALQFTSCFAELQTSQKAPFHFDLLPEKIEGRMGALIIAQ